MKALNLGPGVNPCPAWDGEQLRVAWQGDPRTADGRVLHEVVLTADLRIVSTFAYDLTAEAAACPCYVTDGDDRWLAHKDGAPDYRLKIRNGAGSVTLATRVQGFIAARGPQLAWQEATGPASWQVKSMPTLAHLPFDVRTSDDAEGIAHIREDGWPLLRHEHRFSSPLGTMPAIEREVVLVESEDLGLIGRWGPDPRWLSIFPGAFCSDPRLALSADGERIAVGGWGPGGILLAVVTKADLGRPHVASVGRPCWSFYFFQTSDRFDDGGPLGSLTFVEDDAWRRVPAVQALLVTVRLIDDCRAAWDRVAAVWVSGATAADVETGTTLARDAMRAAGVPRRPVLGYVDAGIPDRMPVGVEWVGLQAYCDPSEDIPTCLRRVRRQLERAPAGQRIALIAQSYDRNGAEPHIEKLAALQAWWPRLVRDDPRIVALGWFSDGRRGGARDYPLLRPWHEATVEAIASTPPIETITPTEPPIEPPEEAVKIEFPPRNETADFITNRLEPYYRDTLHEGARSTHVNAEGYSVWAEGYLRRRVKGMSHQDASDDVFREIEGKPTTEPPDFR